MNVYNLTKNEVFNINKGNSTKNIDFNVDSKDEFAIYDLNNYDNVRPIFKKYMTRNEIRTNASSLIGQEAICIKPILDNQWGEVKIQGKIWTAISNENIYENERVIVLAITGVKLQVRKKK